MGTLLLILAALQDPGSLIQELQSDDLARRNAATAKLEKLGPSSLPTLTAARDKSRDPEVRSRLEKIIGEIEVEHARPRRMILTRGREVDGELYLWENGGVQRLTENKKIECGPRLSPDGARVVYFSMDSMNDWKKAEVFVMSLGDRKVVRIGTGFEPAWSPDGARIAVLQENEIHLVAADGTNDQVVFRSKSGVRLVHWSSDGKELAVEQDEEIWIVTVADGTGRRVGGRIPGTGTLAAWSWSPDGKSFGLVAGSGPYLWNVYTMGGDGSAIRMLTKEGWIGHGIVQWSPDSGRLAVCVRLGSGIGPPDPAPGGLDTGLHLLDSKSGVFRKIAKDVNPSLRPQWSGDGKFIVYVSGKEEIWICHVSTAAARQVTEMAVPVGAAASWFPPTVHWPAAAR